MGPTRQLDPHVIETKQSSGAAWHCAATARRRRASPAVTPSLRDLRDLAHRLSYSVGPLVGATHGGGAHGGSAERDDGATPVKTTAKQAQALTSFYGLSRT